MVWWQIIITTASVLAGVGTIIVKFDLAAKFITVRGLSKINRNDLDDESYMAKFIDDRLAATKLLEKVAMLQKRTEFVGMMDDHPERVEIIMKLKREYVEDFGGNSYALGLYDIWYKEWAIPYLAKKVGGHSGN